MTTEELLLKINGDAAGAVAALGSFAGGLDGAKGKAQEFGDVFMQIVEHPIQGLEKLSSMVGEQLMGALEGLGGVAAGAGAGVAAVGAAAIGVGAAVFALAEGAAKAGEEVLAFSQKSGVAVANVGPLEFAAKAAGGSLSDLTSILTKIDVKAAADQGGKFADALKDIGINADAFKKMDSEQQILALAKGFQQGAASGNTMADAVALMGKSGAENLPLLMKMNDGLIEQGKTLGVQWSSELTESSEKFGVGINTIETALGNIATNIGAAVLPAVADLIAGFANSQTFIDLVTGSTIVLKDILGAAVEVVGHATQATIDLLAPLVAVGTFVGTFLYDVWSAIIGKIVDFVGTFASFDGVSTIVQTLGALFGVMRDTVVHALSEMLSWLEKIPGVGPMIKDAIDKASSAFDGMTTAGSAVGRMSDKLGTSLFGTAEAHDRVTEAAGNQNRAHTETATKADELSKKLVTLQTDLDGASAHHLSVMEVEKLHGSEIDTVALQAKEMGKALPDSIQKWKDAIDASKLDQKMADELVLVDKAVVEGYSDQAKSAEEGLKAIGGKYSSLLTKSDEIKTQLLKDNKDTYDGELTYLDSKLKDEITKLGPTPEVYKAAYDKANAAIDLKYNGPGGQLDLLAAKIAAEKLKLDTDVPDHTSKAYAAGTLKIQNEYTAQLSDLDTKQAEEKTKLGATPTMYADAWGDATTAMKAETKKQKEDVGTKYDEITDRVVGFMSDYTTNISPMSQQLLDQYNQMIADGDASLPQLEKVAKDFGASVKTDFDTIESNHQAMTDHIQTALTGLFNGALHGWDGFKSAVATIGDDILKYFEDMIVKKMAASWANALSGMGQDYGNWLGVASGGSVAAMSAAALEVGSTALVFYWLTHLPGSGGPQQPPEPTPGPPPPGGGGNADPGSSEFAAELAYAQALFDTAMQNSGGSHTPYFATFWQYFDGYLTQHPELEGRGNGFVKGGLVTEAMAARGGPGGTDTVPAWLTPGERVLNVADTQAYDAGLLETMRLSAWAVQQTTVGRSVRPSGASASSGFAGADVHDGGQASVTINVDASGSIFRDRRAMNELADEIAERFAAKYKQRAAVGVR